MHPQVSCLLILVNRHLPHESVLVCIFRGEEIIIPRGVTRLRAGDQVIALTTPELEDELRAAVLERRRR